LIYDCFTFFSELDLLEIRLDEMAGSVDCFVLAEAPVTHQGRRKPLYFHESRKRFRRFASKIRHVLVEDMPDDPALGAWGREHHQRNALKRGLADAADGDLVIVSDADEILRPAAIQRAAARPDFSFFHLDLFIYYLDWQALEWPVGPWIKPYAAPWRVIRAMPELTRPREMDPYAYLDEIGRDPQEAIVAGAGWHFSWLGGPDTMLDKLESFAHTEPEVAVWRDRARLAEMVRNGRFFYNDVPLTPKPVDDSFPALVAANPELYLHKGLLSPASGARHGRFGRHLRGWAHALRRLANRPSR
jgi:Glycosyltransferase family 17